MLDSFSQEKHKSTWAKVNAVLCYKRKSRTPDRFLYETETDSKYFEP